MLSPIWQSPEKTIEKADEHKNKENYESMTLQLNACKAKKQQLMIFDVSFRETSNSDAKNTNKFGN